MEEVDSPALIGALSVFNIDEDKESTEILPPVPRILFRLRSVLLLISTFLQGSSPVSEICRLKLRLVFSTLFSSSAEVRDDDKMLFEVDNKEELAREAVFILVLSISTPSIMKVL